MAYFSGSAMRKFYICVWSVTIIRINVTITVMTNRHRQTIWTLTSNDFISQFFKITRPSRIPIKPPPKCATKDILGCKITVTMSVTTKAPTMLSLRSLNLTEVSFQFSKVLAKTAMTTANVPAEAPTRVNLDYCVVDKMILLSFLLYMIIIDRFVIKT